MNRIVKKKLTWGGVEYYQETQSGQKWQQRLEEGNKAIGPYPLPVGHEIFKHPESYDAILVDEFGH